MQGYPIPGAQVPYLRGMSGDGHGVRVVRGDLFASGADALVNPINIAGAMGAGLALAFRRRHPGLYADYRARVAGGTLAMGEPYLWQGDGAAVINFPTKRHWRDDSSWPDISAGIGRLADLVPQWGLASLAVPALGCGLGGLDWKRTRPALEQALRAVPARVLLFVPAA